MVLTHVRSSGFQNPGIFFSFRDSVKVILACEQALHGAPAAGRETLQLRLWNLNICIENVDAKC